MQYWQLVKWGSNNFSLLIPITTITTNILMSFGFNKIYLHNWWAPKEKNLDHFMWFLS